MSGIARSVMPSTVASEESLAKARSLIGAWVASHHGAVGSTDRELIRAVCDLAKAESDFDLIAGYDPEVHEVTAQWHFHGGPARNMEERVQAKTVESACLLACGMYVTARMIAEAKTHSGRIR